MTTTRRQIRVTHSIAYCTLIFSLFPLLGRCDKDGEKGQSVARRGCEMFVQHCASRYKSEWWYNGMASNCEEVVECHMDVYVGDCRPAAVDLVAYAETIRDGDGCDKLESMAEDLFDKCSYSKSCVRMSREEEDDDDRDVDFAVRAAPSVGPIDAIPPEQSVGKAIRLEPELHSVFDDDEITYRWSSTSDGGSFDDSRSAFTNYNCLTEGDFTLSLEWTWHTQANDWTYETSIDVKCGLCGDENLDSDEECDDGNSRDGDGCSAECQIEQNSPAVDDLDGGVGDSGNQSCNRVIISSKEDLETVSKCTSIDGDLMVLDTAVGVTDLEILADLEVIKGNVYLSGPDMTSVNGLHRLTSIGGSLMISAPLLTNLDGLNNLKSVGSDLRVLKCVELESLSGLSDLISVGGDLVMMRVSSLTNLDAFSNLKEIKGQFIIHSAPKIPTCEAKELIQRLNLPEDTSLTNICGTQMDECGGVDCPVIT